MYETGERELIADEIVGNVVRAALFAALMGAFAYVSFPNPLSPGVPVTLQVLGVFLAGILLGPVWGLVAMIVYLLAGALGAPVFSMGQAGVGVLLGERVGYFLGFPVATGVIGLLVHGGPTVSAVSQRTTLRLVGAMAVGVAIIYLFGVLGLAVRLELALADAVMVGAIAFIPAEAVKMAAAIGIVRSERLAAV